MLNERKKYSLRKYKVGLFSVLVGAGFAVAAQNGALAAEVENTATPVVSTIQSNTTEATPTPEKTIEKKTENTIQSTPQAEKVEVKQNNKTQASGTPASNEVTTNNTADTTIAPNTNPNKVSEENSLINVQPLWDKGIKGQGRVVAVLDTGLDISHNLFQLLDKSKARYKNEAELEAAKKKAGINYGKWYNDKVIFAYNYSDMNDDIKEFDTLSHGTHVSGSAVGNGTEPAPTGDIIKGVAPEAQLIFMRLFSEKKGGTQQSFTMVKAIEDAVKLGADTINMSFGSPTGMIDDLDDATRAALEKARKAGVTIVTAGGNYATSGYWHAKPKADNPDYGTANTPAVDPNVLAISAYNASVAHKTSISLDVPQLKDNADLNNGHSDIVHYLLTFNAKGDQDYVYLPLGEAGSYSDKSVNGKIVLVESGGSVTDNDKLVELRKAGAKGVLIYQNKEQGDTPTKLYLGGYESSYIPVGIIGNKLGVELAANAGKYKLNIKDTVVKEPYKDAKKMLYFSGWGVSTEGELKPDVAFPGGMIYSSVNNGLYYMNSGTSMATPHAAGSVALIRQVLEERFPNYSKEQLESLLQNLVMSTAKPAINPESNTYYSPRQQGAGLADVTAAAYGDLYLTTKDKKPSIALGNVGDKFEYEVTVHNLSNKDRKLEYNTVVNTDEVVDGRATLKARQLTDVKGESIIVPANGSKTIKVSVDTSKYSEELSKLMKNGYFLEGFTFFKDSETKKEVVSAPFLGFKGTFQDLEGIEKPIYDFKDKEKPFYYYTDDKADTPTKDEGNHFTSLVSDVYTNGNYNEAILGENGTKYDANNLYFSPNGDGNYDSVKLKAVLLRNVDNIHVTVYKKDDVNRTQPIFESGNESQRKSDYGWAMNARSAVVSSSDWNGKDKDGNIMPDGEYQYVITYRPSAAGAKKQELNFIVKIDRTAPTLEKKSDLYNKTTRVFNPGKVIENGSGLDDTSLVYTKDGEEVEVKKEKNGTYKLPKDVDLSTVRFYIWDKVQNMTTLDINGNLVVKPTTPSNNTNNDTTTPTEKDTSGRIEVKFTDDSSGADYGMYPEITRYIVLDENGKRVDVELNKHYESTLPTLPYGKYTIKIVDQDQKVTWVSSPEATVTIDKDNPQKVVDFRFNYADTNRLDVTFNQTVPEGTKVFAVSKSGKEYELTLGKYNKQAFEKLLLNGDYTIRIELPEGYTADKNNFDYAITNGIHNVNINITNLNATPSEDNTNTDNTNTNNTNNNSNSNVSDSNSNNSDNNNNSSDNNTTNNTNSNKLPNNENTKPLYVNQDGKKIPTSKVAKPTSKLLPQTGLDQPSGIAATGFAVILAGIALAVRKRQGNK